MFGGLSFMLNEQMVVAVDREGDLIVRVDPSRSRDLLTRPGARPREMGTGRPWPPLAWGCRGCAHRRSSFVPDRCCARIQHKDNIALNKFEGFPTELFDFFRPLEEDNSREFWDANKARPQCLFTGAVGKSPGLKIKGHLWGPLMCERPIL